MRTRTFVEPHTASSRGKVVVFVPFAKVLVKLATAVQFVLPLPQRNSGTADHPFVPVDLTVIKLATSMNTIVTVGGVAGVTTVKTPLMPLWLPHW